MPNICPVVLDADSVMTGDCLCGLVRLMEANPNAGIIQSSPKASGMDTLYARCQQADITVADGSHVINFCANNYLGLANHPDLIA